MSLVTSSATSNFLLFLSSVLARRNPSKRNRLWRFAPSPRRAGSRQRRNDSPARGQRPISANLFSIFGQNRNFSKARFGKSLRKNEIPINKLAPTGQRPGLSHSKKLPSPVGAELDPALNVAKRKSRGRDGSEVSGRVGLAEDSKRQTSFPNLSTPRKSDRLEVTKWVARAAAGGQAHGSGIDETNPRVITSVVGAESQKRLLLSSFLAAAVLTLST